MSMAGARCMAMSWCSVIRGSREAVEFERAVQRWNIRWAIPPNDAKLIALLRRSGWKRIAHNNVGVIYVGH